MFIEIFLFVVFFVILFVIISRIVKINPNLISVEIIREAEKLLAGTDSNKKLLLRGKNSGHTATSRLADAARKGTFSNMFINEQKKELTNVASKTLEKIEKAVSSKKLRYCHCIIASGIVKLESIIETDPELFDFDKAIKQIGSLEKSFEKSIPVIEEIDSSCEDLNGLMKSLDASNEKMSEYYDAILESFNEIRERISNITDFDFVTICEIDKDLEDLIAVVKQISGSESSQSSNASYSEIWIDYYEILDISSDASKSDIDKARKRKLLEYHPDKLCAEISRISNPVIVEELKRLFHEKTIVIIDAYSVLSNDKARTAYDIGYKKRKGGA